MPTEAIYQSDGDSGHTAVLESDPGWHTAEAFDAARPWAANRQGGAGDTPEARAFAEAQLALGARMCEVGIDDGKLCAQVAEVEGRIRMAEAAGLTSRGLRRERDALLRRLADAALADDAPLPGAEAEYLKAREALTALRSGSQTPAQVARPRAGGRWKMLAAGCAAASTALALVVLRLLS